MSKECQKPYYVFRLTSGRHALSAMPFRTQFPGVDVIKQFFGGHLDFLFS